MGLIAKALRSRAIRFALTAFGLGLCTLLVEFLGAVYHSVSRTATGYLGQPRVDVWVAPAGTDNFMRSSALLPAVLADSLALMPGVIGADPIVRAYVTVMAANGAEGEGSRLSLIGIGYRAPAGRGGPPRMAAGRPPSGPREVAIDRAAARRLRAAVGDTVWINSDTATITGLTAATNLLATQLVFADLDALNAGVGMGRAASFVLLELGPGVATAELANAIRERFGPLEVIERERFLEANQREIGAGFLPLMSMVAALGLFAAAALVALLLHALIDEGRGEIALLLAVGTPIRSIISGILIQALLLVITGAVVGNAAALALSLVLDRWMPTIPVPFEPAVSAVALPLFLAVAIVAALLPLARLRRIDPLEAFRP